MIGRLALTTRIAFTLDVMGDCPSPYVPAEGALKFLLVIENGKLTEFRRLTERHVGKALHFHFTAPATVWEGVAAGNEDPIKCGLRDEIKVRGDVKFLMENVDAVKLAIDLYGHQGSTDWALGRPPYEAT